MEVLKKKPLKSMKHKRKDGKRGELSYDSESCSSRMRFAVV